MPPFSKILSPLQKLFTPKKVEFVKPLISIGLGSAGRADSGLIKEFRDVETIHTDKILLECLDGDSAAITKMSPWEISQLSSEVWSKAGATGALFPGSTSTIADFFQRPNAEIPKKLDFYSSRSIFKMAQTLTALSKGTPSLFSCDGFHYPLLALGGEVSDVLKGGLVEHDGISTHDLIITSSGWFKPKNWLEKEAAKISNKRDGNGNIVISDVASTHPLIPTKIPSGVKILATSPDNVAAILEFSEKAIAVLDHPEAGAVVSDSQRKFEATELRFFGESFEKKETSNQQKLLWNALKNKFLNDASFKEETTPNPIFSPRVEEILQARSLAELGATKIAFSKGGKS